MSHPCHRCQHPPGRRGTGLLRARLVPYAHRVSPAPWVVVLTGAPGSGKSSTARTLASGWTAAVLDQDAMTNPLVDVVAGLIDAPDYDDPRLAALVRAARYECLLRVAADCVAAGLNVVLVAPFTAERRDPEAWDRLASTVAGFGGRARLVWLCITPEELAVRLRGRAAARDAGKLKDAEAFVAGLDLSAPRTAFLQVDAALSPAEQAATIRAALG
jgi:predicted kinase